MGKPSYLYPKENSSNSTGLRTLLILEGESGVNHLLHRK
jgi:hypothetical protein